MKRDFRLIRLLLLAYEAHADDGDPDLQFEGFSSAEIAWHVELMQEAGLLRDRDSYRDRFAPRLGKCLTWSGCDFLDACRDQTTWNKALGQLAKAGGFTFDIVKQVLVKIIAEQLR